jgi:cytochrome b561
MKQVLAYTRTAISLHWLMALLIVVAFPVGVVMHNMALSPDKLRMMSYHKWIGVTIFLLLLARLAWRLLHKPAPMTAHMPAWQQKAAGAIHFLLYVLMVAIPLSGWLMSSAKGFQTVYFGVLPLPDLLGKDKALGEQLGEVHEMLNVTLLVLFVLHVAAAIKHHFMDRDDTLIRMLPMLDRRAK